MPLITLSTDFDYFQTGDFIVVNNVWNNGALINGVNYTQSASFESITAPNAVTFNWNWLVTPMQQVYAYPEIVAGYKSWDQLGSTALTSRVDELRKFDVTFDLDISGSTGNFNVAIEFWLTTKAQGSGADITTEVMVWLHNGDYTTTLTPEFVYTDGAYSGETYVIENMTVGNGTTWRYIAMTAQTQYLTGTIDLHDVLVLLQRENLIDPSDYITGFEIGSEVTGGIGQLIVNTLSYSFDQYVITEGADSILGSAKRDNIDGRAGNDSIYGLIGDDFLNGGRGEDQLYGGLGGDVHFGGDDGGLDFAHYDDANFGNLTLRLDNSALNVGAVAVGDTYAGIEGIIGGLGNDTIYGDARNNQLWGGNGSDYLNGQGGNDTLIGGAGSDQFAFTTLLGSAYIGPTLRANDNTSWAGANAKLNKLNTDRIVDFVHGVDEILLAQSIFTSIGSFLDVTELRFGTVATDANDFLIYNAATGQLYYDANGSDAGGNTIFAILEVGTVLTFDDILLI